jgi:putative colanic acid biosynthesis UDP-glucose lipid carrier transferase
MPTHLTLLLRFLTPTLIIASLVAITGIYGVKFSDAYVLLATMVFLLTLIVFRDSDMYRTWHQGGLKRHTQDVLFSWLVLAGFLLFIGYATKHSAVFSRRVFLTWFLVTPPLILLGHALAWNVILRYFVSQRLLRTAVIVGANDVGWRLADEIMQHPYLGIRFKGFFDDRNAQRLESRTAPHILGKLGEIPAYVQNEEINQIYLTLPMVQAGRVQGLLDDLRDTTASIYFVPDIFTFDLIQARMDDINGIPVVAVCETPFHGVNGALKWLTDMVIAGVALVILSPVMLTIALAVKLSSPGPVIFKQRRYGLDGREIVVFKFRTMTVCEDGNEISQARRKDTRVTPIGAFLRRSSLDELPQFINVLQGKMSVVGPRPHPVVLNEAYRKLVKGYMIRHKVKPGITGWAQVNGLRGETETVDKMKARIEYDLDYLRNWSVMLDLKIIIKTAFMVFSDRNAY